MVGITEVSKVFDVVNAVEKGDWWNEFFVEVVDETLKQIFSDDGTRLFMIFWKNTRI